jgi:hypothetical protein
MRLARRQYLAPGNDWVREALIAISPGAADGHCDGIQCMQTLCLQFASTAPYS